jgi:AraC-like DNA-binding protein
MPVFPFKRREKVFGAGRPRALDREGKTRLMALARALMRPTQKGKHYGLVTAKGFAVLEALLWQFHNAKSGLCFPSLKRIAEAAGCTEATVCRCLKMLEAAGLLTWVNRLVRVREHGEAGWRWRVLRTSNGYAFNDPRAGRCVAQEPASASNYKKSSETTNQISPYNKAAGEDGLFAPLEAALGRLHGYVKAGAA